MSVETLEFNHTYKSLKARNKYRRFNNSLAHFYGPYYLMTYRLFYPLGRGEKRFNDTSRKFHPWSSGWSSRKDVTILAVLRLQNNGFEVLREMELDYVLPLQRFAGNLQDARIVKLNGSWYVYGQAWVEPYMSEADYILQAAENGPITKCLRDDPNCAAVVVMLQKLKFTMDKHKLPQKARVVSMTLPCIQTMSNKIRNGMAIEKNWCFFAHNKQIYFEYFLDPHIVVDLKCQQKYETPSPFSAIRKHYKCGIFFSPGGPLAPWSKGKMLGVGHVKYKWHCANLLDVSHTRYLHPQDWGGFVYAMFFYVVESRPPFRIVQFSHAFIPQYPGQKYALVFPMASVKVSRSKWAISYGEGDDTPNILYLTTSQIRSKLIKRCSPANYRVEWWPQVSKT